MFLHVEEDGIVTLVGWSHGSNGVFGESGGFVHGLIIGEREGKDKSRYRTLEDEEGGDRMGTWQ